MRLRNKKLAKYLPTRGGKWWVFRDTFGAALAAGNVDGSAAAPGKGLRAVTDVELKIFTTGGRLRGGGQDTPVWGESKVVWTQPDGSGFARVHGRTLAALILPEDTIIDADIAFGFATATDITDPRTDGHGWLQEAGGALKVITPGATIPMQTTIQRQVRPMQYLVGVTLNDIGAVVWYSTFGLADGIQMVHFPTPQFRSARIMWVEYADITEALFPYIAFLGKIDAPPEGYPNGNSLEDLRIVDPTAWLTGDPLAGFAERFEREDNAQTMGNAWTVIGGTWGITSQRAYLAVGAPSTGWYGAYHNSGLPDGDGIYQWFVTMPDTAVPYFGLIFRYQDAQNFYRIHNFAQNNIYLQKYVGGALSVIGSNSQTWVAGATYRITAYVEDGRIRIYVNNTLKIDVTGDDDLAEVATIGMMIFDDGSGRDDLVGHKFDNVMAFPMTFTLPALLCKGKAPGVLSGGGILAQDGFVDDDAMLLADHAAEAGGAWEMVDADWTIQGNQADPQLPAVGYTHCVQNLGVTDAECQVDITVPAGVDDFFYGITGRYEDADNWFSIRLCMANYSPGSHEVEIVAFIDGDDIVRHKINLGNYLVNEQTYTLKTQFKGDLIQVFLDGDPVVSYYTIDEDPLGTKFGLNTDHASRTDDGGTFDNWIARAL